MASYKVSMGEFSETLKKIMDTYEKEVIEVAGEVVKKVARAGAKNLRGASPQGRTGKYRQGWSSKENGGRVIPGAVIYGRGRTKSLAHLLEYGVAGRYGGRVHIAPVADWVETEVMTEMIRRIEQIDI